MSNFLKNGDALTRIGEAFGNSLADLVGSTRLFSVTIKEIDEANNNAMVGIYEEDEALPVPLTFLNIEDGMFKVVPSLESTAVIGFTNGDENRPFFLSLSRIDRVELVRGGTSVVLTLDPEDETKDNINVVIGDSSIDVTNEEVNVVTGESTLKMNTDVIEFNGGGLDGLVKINELTDKLNGLVDAFNNHVHNVPSGSFLIAAQAGVPNPAPVPVQKPTQPANTFSKGDYENEKVKQ